MKEFYQGKKVLITGGLGFIGSNLAIALEALGAKVAIVDNAMEGQGANAFNVDPIKDRLELHMADMRNPEIILGLVKNMDLIFNFAAKTSPEDSMSRPFVDTDINCVGNLILLQACRRSNPGVRIIYAGIKESRPTDVFHVNRIAAEMYHEVYHHHGIISYTGLRLNNVYGPRARMRGERIDPLSQLVKLAVEGKEIAWHGDEGEIREYCFIEDIVEAFLLAGASDNTLGKTYNIGGYKVALRSAAEIIAKLAVKEKNIQCSLTETMTGMDDEEIRSDFSSFHLDTGWAPRTPLKEGLAKTIDYYRENKQYYW